MKKVETADKTELSDRIFKFLQKCNKEAHISDMHSFEATVKGGKAWVECRGNEVFITHQVFTEKDNNGEEVRHSWAGTTIAAANRLALLGMEFPVDM